MLELIFVTGLLVLLIADSLLRFILLCLRAILQPPRNSSEANDSECVILIAARDEAGTIEPTIKSLIPHLIEWPGSQLWVVADHCRDETAAEASQAGAQVAVREQGQLGKGAVINWWLQHYQEEWRDRAAIVVLDADSRIKSGSLRALRCAMADGVDAAQAFIAPLANATTGRLAGWSEVLMQRIDDEVRRRLGWPVPLRGTGMALRAGLLAELAPQLHTLAEDLELDVLLAARSSRVAFVPEAVIWDPKPRQTAGASRQRARWLQGQLQVIRDYPREILRALFCNGLGTWILLFMLLLRPKIIFIGLRILALVVVLWFVGWQSPWWIIAAGLAMDISYYLGGAVIVDNPRRYLLDLLAAPHYAAVWLYSLVVATVRRGWLRAGRQVGE